MKRKTFAAGVLAVGLFAGLMPTLIPATQASGAPVPGGEGGKVTLCQPGQHIHVDGPWGHYVLKNNDLNLGFAGDLRHPLPLGPRFSRSPGPARTSTVRSRSPTRTSTPGAPMTPATTAGCCPQGCSGCGTRGSLGSHTSRGAADGTPTLTCG